MNQFYDIHTHQTNRAHSIYALQVGVSTEPPAEGLFSVGVHPYTLPQFNMSWIDRLGELARHPRCVAVGETGLDFRAEYMGTAKQQLAVFDEHIFLAQKLQKPLIIHSVRALPQTLARLRDVAFVVHGFVGSVDDFDQIAAAGGWVSLGEKLTRDPALCDRVAQFDPMRVVLETDDSTTPIQAVYAAWSAARGQEMNAQVAQNVHTLFPTL